MSKEAEERFKNTSLVIIRHQIGVDGKNVKSF